MLWKPILMTVGVLVIKEAGVYVIRFAVERFLTERLRSKLNVVKRDFRETQEDIQNGVDPNETRRQEAQRRDESGRFTKNGDHPEKGGGQ